MLKSRKLKKIKVLSICKQQTWSLLKTLSSKASLFPVGLGGGVSTSETKYNSSDGLQKSQNAYVCNKIIFLLKKKQGIKKV